MMIIGEVNFIMSFTANGDFILLWDDEAIVYIGSFDDFEGDCGLLGHLNLELIGTHFQDDFLL